MNKTELARALNALEAHRDSRTRIGIAPHAKASTVRGQEAPYLSVIFRNAKYQALTEWRRL